MDQCAFEAWAKDAVDSSYKIMLTTVKLKGRALPFQVLQRKPSSWGTVEFQWCSLLQFFFGCLQWLFFFSKPVQMWALNNVLVSCHHGSLWSHSSMGWAQHHCSKPAQLLNKRGSKRRTSCWLQELLFYLRIIYWEGNWWTPNGKKLDCLWA